MKTKVLCQSNLVWNSRKRFNKGLTRVSSLDDIEDKEFYILLEPFVDCPDDGVFRMKRKGWSEEKQEFIPA